MGEMSLSLTLKMKSYLGRTWITDFQANKKGVFNTPFLLQNYDRLNLSRIRH